jgi:glycosyltransferase involved in cell wall biosynthesis
VAVDLRALVPAPTGIGVYTRSLLLELARLDRFELVGMAHRAPHFADELGAAGIAIEVHPAPLGVVWQQIHAARRLRRGDIDLFWSPITTLPWHCPVPAVVTVHDLTPLLLPETHRFKVRWSVLPFLRKSLEDAAVVLAISHATARDIVRQFPQVAAKVRVSHLGIDAEFAPGMADAIDATRRSVGAPNGYLLFAGTLEPRKGVGVLLEAWSGLRAEDPATPPLVLCGPVGWKIARLEARIEALRSDGLIALGRVPRARQVELMQAASVFVFPSLAEGFGLPPAEAMACGVPVVVSEGTSLPEVVGDAALRVPPGEVPPLSAAIRRVLREPALAARLRDAGLAQARAFSWPSAAAVLADALDAALASRPSAT